MSQPDDLFALLCERLLPQPRSITATGGDLVWGSQTLQLQPQTDLSLRVQQQLAAVVKEFSQPGGSEVTLAVTSGGVSDDGAADNYATLGSQPNEGYELCVTSQGITLKAATDVGVLRGAQTLRQLLVHAQLLHLKQPVFSLPCLRIDDQPALAWRGLLLDVARHFIELPALLRTLDGMAQHKLNVLHLHLTDDQAFRFPSSAYPKLCASNKAYSLDELHKLVAHANSLGIRIVPELDMPGHTTSWLAAYPEWALHDVAETKRFGVHKACLNPASETTYRVIADLLKEFASVFSDECVHIGGDEVHPAWWSEHADVQEFMHDKGFAAPSDLQAYFNVRVAELLAGEGKRMLVWDEAVHESLPKDTVVQAWRGMTARDAATAQGYECIVSAPYYLDLFYPTDLHTRFTPLVALPEAIEAEDALLEDPRLAHVAGGLEWTKQWRNRPSVSGERSQELAVGDSVLGAEACLWSELVDTELLDVRLWSRLPLLAEMFWCGDSASENSCNGQYTRARHSLLSWRACGGPDLTAALSGSLSSAQLSLLAPLGITVAVSELLALLEPSKWYSRLLGADALAARLQGSEMPQARPYGTQTELRSIADVISPQSYRTAEFSELLQRWQHAPLGEQDSILLHDWLSSWQAQSDVLLALTLEPNLAEQLATLAHRLVCFVQLLQPLLAERKGEALVSTFFSAADRANLQEWFVPVGELMLAPMGALLVQIELTERASATHKR